MASNHKQTRGRQKISMKRIENDDDRLITFSKRRSGIYKKASELVTLCGAEVGVLVFSPSGKPFSFGHPSLEAVANRYLGEDLPPDDTTHPLIEAHRKVRINDLSEQHNELTHIVDAEKDKGKVLKDLTTEKDEQGWWEIPTDELDMQELQKMYAMLGELRIGLCNKINEKKNGASSSSMFPPDTPSHVTDPNASDENGSEASNLLILGYGTNEGRQF